MDTRHKIIDIAEAARLWGLHPSLTIVTGYFDVLLAGHAAELREIKQRVAGAPLMVALTTPPEPVLSTRARAELVAALAAVDYVVTAESGNLAGLLRAAGQDVVELERAHGKAFAQLVLHVHRRQES